MIKDSNKRITTTINKNMLERVKKEAEIIGLTLTTVINMAIIEWLEKHSKTDQKE